MIDRHSPPSPQELDSGHIRCCYHNIQDINVLEDGKRVSIKTYYMPIEVARKVIALIVELNPKSA